MLGALLSACSSTPEKDTTVGTAGAIASATAEFTKAAKAAGGVEVSIGGERVLVASDFSAFDIAPDTALHYIVVGRVPYIDASLNGDSQYVEGTPENLTKMGVDPKDMAKSIAKLEVLMKLPSTTSSWIGAATNISAISNRTTRMTVPVEKIDGAKDAGFPDVISLFFKLDEEGSLVQWGVFEKSGQTISTEQFTKVSIEKPSKTIDPPSR